MNVSACAAIAAAPRLVRTRQMGKAASMAEMVIEQLASDTTLYRQHAIYLLEDIIKSGLSGTGNGANLFQSFGIP